MGSGRYQVGDVIRGDHLVLAVHEGNFGVVYICRQDLHGGRCLYKAIKTFREGGSPICKGLFERELTYWSSLPAHSNVVQARDADTVNQLLILEYVHGPSLHEIAWRSPVHARRFLQWAREIASGLHFLHVDNHFVHRDLRPANVLIDMDRDLAAKITDLGIGKPFDPSAAVHTVIGTHRYMAPEVHDAHTDYRSDIFSFGATLYFLLAGRYAVRLTTRDPFKITPLSECGLGIPEEVARFVERCLDRDPEARFPSIREVTGALDRLEEWNVDHLPFEWCEGHRYPFYHAPSLTACCPFCRFEAHSVREKAPS